MEFCRRKKQLFSLFFAVLASNLQRCQIMTLPPLRTRPVLDLSNINIKYIARTLVRSKYSLTPKKLLQKVSQLILVGFSVLFYIPKVYQSRTPEKCFFSRWRPRWPPKPLNDHNSVTINSNLMILGAKNTLRS